VPENVCLKASRELRGTSVGFISFPKEEPSFFKGGRGGGIYMRSENEEARMTVSERKGTIIDISAMKFIFLF